MIGELTHFVTSSIRSKILFSFVIVLVLVVAVAIAGYYQLGQVRSASERVTPTTSELEFLQGYARAVSSLGADVESYVAVGGPQVIQDRIIQDLASVKGILGSVIENADEGMDPFFLTQLERETANLESEVLDLLEVAPADLRSGKTNERVALIYVRIDTIERLHQQLSIEMLDQLRATALQQETITSNVSAQFLILAVVTFVIVVVATLLVTRSIATPVAGLAEAAARIAGGDLEARAPVITRDEIGQLAAVFNRMTTQLHELIEGLEQRVAERTRNLEASAQVARAVTSILEIDRLIRGVVELIRERFDLYYVGLFLTDEAGEWAVLRAGTGGAGRTMLARGHRIRVGEGMVGWSIAHAQARVLEEIGADAVRLATAELPDTRSEAALALRSRGQVLGALTVQSDRPGAFDEQIIAVLQTMADQVAVAIDNARLFAESQAALEAERRAYGELSAQAWGELLRTRTDWGYRYVNRIVTPIEGDWSPEMRRAEQTGRTVRARVDAGTGDGAGGPALAIPIQVRGQVIGVLRFRKGKGSETWTAEEVALLETMVAQLDVALESARLYHDSQRREIHERIVGQFATRVRGTLDLETMLETAVQEVQQSLDLPEVMIRLATRLEDDDGAERTEAE